MAVDFKLDYTAEEINERLGMLKDQPVSWELIWENASISSEFGATTLSGLDLADSNMVAITYWGQTNSTGASSSYGFKTEFIPTNSMGALQSASCVGGNFSHYVATRAVNVRADTGKIEFDSAKPSWGIGTLTIAEDDKNACRPFRIYKLKNVPSTVK